MCDRIHTHSDQFEDTIAGGDFIHRTSDVTQGYVQFDLEQLRSAMQAVEDFVLQHVRKDLNVQSMAANDFVYARSRRTTPRRSHDK